MTEAERWLNALPPESAERQLLLAGRADNPPPGGVDLDWQALTVALGAAATTTTVATSAAAISAPGGTTTGLVHAAASSAAGAASAKAGAAGVGLSLAVKSVTIGFAVGMGLIGAGTAISEIQQLDARPATTSALRHAVRSSGSAALSRHAADRDAGNPTPPAPSPSLPEVPPLAAELPSSRAKRSVSELVEAETTPALARHASTALPQPGAAASQVSSPVPPRVASLAEQARDLAQVKRLIDAGDSTEAIRRLQISFAEGMHPALSEERDALYVQALDSAQMRARAVLFAKRFLARYPNSPHSATMRRLIAAK